MMKSYESCKVDKEMRSTARKVQNIMSMFVTYDIYTFSYLCTKAWNKWNYIGKDVMNVIWALDANGFLERCAVYDTAYDEDVEQEEVPFGACAKVKTEA